MDDMEHTDQGQPAITLEQAQARVETRTQPRVTKESIEAKIDHVHYYRHETVTVCVMRVKNGFKVLGKAVTAAPENYDEFVGKRYAYEDAFKQLWQLEDYLLCEILLHQQVTL
jgi:hypothetical protein